MAPETRSPAARPARRPAPSPRTLREAADDGLRRHEEVVSRDAEGFQKRTARRQRRVMQAETRGYLNSLSLFGLLVPQTPTHAVAAFGITIGLFMAFVAAPMSTQPWFISVPGSIFLGFGPLIGWVIGPWMLTPKSRRVERRLGQLPFEVDRYDHWLGHGAGAFWHHRGRYAVIVEFDGDPGARLLTGLCVANGMDVTVAGGETDGPNFEGWNVACPGPRALLVSPRKFPQWRHANFSRHRFFQRLALVLVQMHAEFPVRRVSFPVVTRVMKTATPTSTRAVQEPGPAP